jgi:hypothetical protein
MDHSLKDPHSPREVIFAVRRQSVEKFVSDNSKCIRMSKCGSRRGLNFQFICDTVWMFLK